MFKSVIDGGGVMFGPLTNLARCSTTSVVQALAVTVRFDAEPPQQNRPLNSLITPSISNASTEPLRNLGSESLFAAGSSDKQFEVIWILSASPKAFAAAVADVPKFGRGAVV